MLKHLNIFFSFLLITLTFTFAQTGTVIKEIDTPGRFCTGLTFDGKYLWTADRKADKLFCIDPVTGKTVKTLESPGYYPTGLAFDGKYLWNADIRGRSDISENLDGMIHQVCPETGEIHSTLKAPAKKPDGITWDGKYLWCVDAGKDKIIKVSPTDGSTMGIFPAPSQDPTGLTWDGKYLWTADRVKDEFYMVDPETGSVIIIADAPGPHIKDLAFDGKHLWCIDQQNNKIYQMKVRDGVLLSKTKERAQKVIYTHQTKNFGPGKLIDMKVHIAIPQNRENQEIMSIKYSPEPSEIVTDQWGQKTAMFNYKDVAPGTRLESEMEVDFKSWFVRYYLYPDQMGSLEDIPQDIKEKYLVDDEKYQINHPIIKETLKNVVGDEKNPYWILRKIHNYLISHLQYIMDGYWDTAPTIIKQKHGSCSEYTFTFLALCRAAGLPAKYVGGTWIKKDDKSMDNIFHRWVEVYLPGYGWIPTDPTHGDRTTPRDQAFPIGLCRNITLINTESGGGSETMGWTYNSNEFYKTEPKTNLNIEYFGDWLPLKEK